MVIHPKTLDRAVKLITKFEGVETEAYQDPQGIATICTGLTKYPNGDIVRIGDVCKASICYQYTKDLIQEESLEYIKNIPGWERLGHGRQASLLSFGWNKGFGVYKTEEFEPIQAILKASIDYPERYEEMSEVLSLYATDQGQESAALLNRRSIEGSEWDKESVKSLYFRAKRDTYLKKAALDYIWLADQAKKKIEEDEIIQVSQSREIPNDLHNWLWIYGISGEWGHNPLPWQEENEIKTRNCWCGKSNCIEKFVSGPAIEKEFEDYKESLEKFKNSIDKLKEQDLNE